MSKHTNIINRIARTIAVTVLTVSVSMIPAAMPEHPESAG